MQLRYYQTEAVRSIYTYFGRAKGNPVVALPTGTGKSVIIAEFIRGVFSAYPNQRIMMLTHVKELIDQNFKKLLQLWATAPAGIYSSGLNRRDLTTPIIYAGIASVHKKAELFGKIDLIIIDECHLVSPSGDAMYRRFIDALRSVNPALKVIGLSATPYRLGVGSLTTGGFFTDICYDLTNMRAFNRLVEEGYLAPLVSKATSLEYDLSDVKMAGGEFVQKDLNEAIDKANLTEAAVAELINLSAGRKHWLIFASGIEHAEHIAETLRNNGVSAGTVHSYMKDKERDQAILDFKSGKYQAMVNNGVLTTGFDFPEIDLIGVMRPTQSTGLWVQMLGRGTRPHPMKANCLVLDFAGNTKRLGPINDPVLPRGKKERKGTAQREAPIKICMNCSSYCHASVRICPDCGAEFPKELKINARADNAEVMRSDAPVYELFTVNNLTYQVHQKAGKPPAMQVSYLCGLRIFKEWVCLEHGGYPTRKAYEWWRLRSENGEIPDTVEEALKRTHELKVPRQIKVWMNKKYPEITGVIFND